MPLGPNSTSHDISIGPHLLGRRPRPTDPRDLSPSDLSILTDRILYAPQHPRKNRRLTTPPTPLDPSETIQTLVESGAFSSWTQILVFWRWLKSRFGDHPSAPSQPTPPWSDGEILNQGNTPHCVGFGWAGFGNSTPYDDHFVNADGDAIYYAAKQLDGEPGQENGSDTRSGAKAMQQRARIAAYAFASDDPATAHDEVTQHLATQGPVVRGTDWYESMFDPTGDGHLRWPLPSGDKIAGGHEYFAIAYDATTDEYECINSWGDWAQAGRFIVPRPLADHLHERQGDACLALELPL